MWKHSHLAHFGLTLEKRFGLIHTCKIWSKCELLNPFSRPLESDFSNNFKALGFVWMNCTLPHRLCTADQGSWSGDFPLYVLRSLYHEGNIQRDFSWVRLAVHDFTIFPHRRSKHFQNYRCDFDVHYISPLYFDVPYISPLDFDVLYMEVKNHCYPATFHTWK